MAEDRPRPPAGTEPAKREDESVPRHRVVWDHGPLGPPPQPGTPGMSRGTTRMVRPTLSTPSTAPPSEHVASSVVEMPPITERVGHAPPAQQQPLPTQSAAMLHVPQHPQAATALQVPARPRSVRPASPTLDRRLVLLSAPDSAQAASFRLLRDNLIAKGLPRVLAVSSAAADDGKTTCAINLALALAEHTPARILLMDGNFFAPSFGEIFSVDAHTTSPAGLDAAKLAPFKIVALRASLHLAVVVQRSGEPLPRFDKQRFDVLLDLLCRTGYDHIIVDAPAIGGSPLVAQLLGGVDGVLMVVRAGRTTSRALRHAIEEIPGGKGLGVALMDAEPR